VLAEVAGGVIGWLLIKTLYPDVTPEEAGDVVIAHLSRETDPPTKGRRGGVGEDLAG
jgi:hypothetical protein